MDEKILELLKKTVQVCRQTRGDGALDRLRDLADEIQTAFPELKPPAPTPVPPAPSVN